jgi:hypothetical protein
MEKLHWPLDIFYDTIDWENDSSLVIERPEDPELLEKLRQKLAEYRNTLFDCCPINSPETLTDAYYKITVLHTVLEQGEVNCWVISKMIAHRCGRIDYKIFSNACGVIADYCETGGQNVKTV